MRARRRGYGAQFAALVAGLLTLAGFNLARHLAAPAVPHASVQPTVTVTLAPSSPASPAAGRPRPSVAGARPVAVGGASGGVHSGASAPSVTPSPSPAGPVPSQRPRPGLGVTAAIVVPQRGAAPVTVRAALVAPAAPPFPDTLLGVGLNLTLP